MSPKKLIEEKLASHHQNVEIATYANLHDLCSALGFTDEEYNSLSNKHARDTFFRVFGRYFNYTKDGWKITILETHNSPLPPPPISRSKKKLKYTSKIMPLLFTWKDDFFCSLNNVYYNFGFFNRLCFSTLQKYNREYYGYSFKNKNNTAEEVTTDSPKIEETHTEDYLDSQAQKEAEKKEQEENLKLFSEIPDFIDECKNIFKRIFSDIQNQLCKFDYTYEEFTIVQDLDDESSADLDEIDSLIDEYPALKALGDKWRPLTSEEHQAIEKFREGILISLNCKDLQDVHNKWLSRTYYRRLNKAYRNLGLGFRGNWYLIYPTTFHKKDIDRLAQYFRTHIYSPSEKATRYFMERLHLEFTSRMSLSDFQAYSKLWFDLFGDMSTEQIREYVSDCLQEINNTVVALCRKRNQALLKKKCAKIEKLKQKEFARMHKAKAPKKHTVYDKYDKNKTDEDSENFPSLMSQLKEAHEYYKKCDLFIEKNIKDTGERHIDLPISQEDMQNLKTAEKFLLEYPIEKWDELFPQEKNLNDDTNSPAISDTETPKKPKKITKAEIKKQKQIAYLLNEVLDEIKNDIPFIKVEDKFYGLDDKPFLKLFVLTKTAYTELEIILDEARNPRRAIDMFIDTLESISSGTKGSYYVNEFVHVKGIKRVFIGVEFSDKRYDEDRFYPYYLYFRKKKGTEYFEILHIIRTYQPYIDFLTSKMEDDTSDEEENDDDIIEF